MAYIKDGVYPIHDEGIHNENPDTSFPVDMTREIAESFGYSFVNASVRPSYNPKYQTISEGTPELIDGEYFQVWNVASFVPQKVTRRQAKQALLLAGMLSQVQPAIDAIVDPTQREMMNIEWNDSQDFERTRPSLINLATALGLTLEQLDDLFVQAIQL
jgi:hypothetical protein